jgi:hypothetical protein
VALTVERMEDGEVSPYLVDGLAKGDQLELRGPIGGYFVWSADIGGLIATGRGRLRDLPAHGDAEAPRGADEPGAHTLAVLLTLTSARRISSSRVRSRACSTRPSRRPSTTRLVQAPMGRPHVDYPTWATVHGLAVLFRGPLRSLPEPQKSHLEAQTLAFSEATVS